MTREEFGKIAAYLKGAFSGKSFLSDKESVGVWYAELKDLDVNNLWLACRRWVETQKYVPSIKELREFSATIKTGEIPGWEDGWNEVCKAIQSYGMYREKEALASLTEITRRCTERLGFYNLCTSENTTADRANFRMIYERMADRERTDTQTNPAILKAIQESGNGTYTNIPERRHVQIEEKHEGIPMPDWAIKKLSELYEEVGG